jgi:O-antigen ligase
MGSNRFVKIYNYIYIFIVLNYTYLVWFVLSIDFTGYGLLALTIVSALVNREGLSKLYYSKPIALWFLWAIYSFLNYCFHSFSIIGLESIFYIFIKLWVPLNLMSIVCIEYRNNSNGALWICFATFVAYTILGMFFDINLLFRTLGESNLLGNRYANTVCVTFFVLCLLNKKDLIKTPLFLILCLLLFVLLAMCGVRKAFVAGFVFFLFWIVSGLNMKSARNVFLLPLIIVLFYFGYTKYIKESYVMVRMEKLEEQQMMDLPSDAPAVLSLLGDRGPHYYYGWQMFLEKPIFGIGLEKARIGESRIHSEYMVELVENGICGFAIFALFHLWLFKRVFRLWKRKTKLSLCIMGGLVGLWFLYLTLWGWDFFPSFILLGVVIGYIKENQFLKTTYEEKQ